MNRRLQYLNLLGVIVLLALCVFQWRTDRRLNYDINRLEKVRIDHEQKLKDQDTALQGANNDLHLFKDQFKQAQTELNETRQKFRALENDNLQLTSERDQLRTSITNWAKAVEERDARIKEGNDRITELAERLNASIRKYNELATNYNNVVKDLNTARGGSKTKGNPESN